MTQTSVAADIHEPLDIELNLAPKFAFDFVLANNLPNAGNFFICPLGHTLVPIDPRFRKDLGSKRWTDAVNVP
jgi:hypothetical protein